jgi:pimeloyl-ACP methyl ester carboxylesterase
MRDILASMTFPRTDADIQLSGKRLLAYAEYGDPGGVPVFLFHGLPGSRLAWGLLPDNPFPPGLRIVAPDRPGYGRSDPNPYHTLLDWANDVTQLADALAIDTFAIVGISGGGPGALACAWKMPERVTSVGVVACPAPTDASGVFKGMSRTNRFFMKLAWRLPRLSTLNVRFLASLVSCTTTYLDMKSWEGSIINDLYFEWGKADEVEASSRTYGRIHT